MRKSATAAVIALSCCGPVLASAAGASNAACHTAKCLAPGAPCSPKYARFYHYHGWKCVRVNGKYRLSVIGG